MNLCKTITIGEIFSSLFFGCAREPWSHQRLNRGAHWEQGKEGAANWVASGKHDNQSLILEIEPIPTKMPTYDANYEQTCYNAISHLLSTAHPFKDGLPVFDSTRSVLYSTTVDLNNYNKTTNFGRLMAESLATALVQHWQNDLVKMTLRQSTTPIIPQSGEFLLSRDVQELAVDYNAGAVLVSTYSVAIDKVYINVQLVNVDFNNVVAAVTFNVPLGPRTIGLLKNAEYPSQIVEYLQ